jgi:hypothetical protein
MPVLLRNQSSSAYQQISLEGYCLYDVGRKTLALRATLPASKRRMCLLVLTNYTINSFGGGGGGMTLNLQAHSELE